MNLLITELQYNKLIKESLSDIAYHFTHSTRLLKILENDEIMLSTALGDERDLLINRGKFNYLSTTRSKNSGYISGNVRITLDGRKINQRYKSVSVDFFKKGPKYSEQEDRVISDNLSIPNFSKYIIQIDIRISEKEISNGYESLTDDMKKIINLCNKKNITLYFYVEDKNFKLQKNQIQFNPKKIENDENPVIQNEIFNYHFASFIAYNNPYAYDKIIEYLNDESKIDRFIKNVKKQKSNYDRIDSVAHKFLKKIALDIDSTRVLQNKDSKFLLSLLIKDMRRHRVNNIKEYILYKYRNNR
jgi:hypothetical protein